MTTRRAKHLSLGLADLGLGPGDKLVIFSENRPEWTMTDFAVLLDRDFDVDSELTPSLKVKRHIVEKTFKALIDFLYKD